MVQEVAALTKWAARSAAKQKIARLDYIESLLMMIQMTCPPLSTCIRASI